MDLTPFITVLIVLLILGLVTRWVFRAGRPRIDPRSFVDAADSSDLGLLDVVAVDVPRAKAAQAKARLDAAGIRASLSKRRDGDMDVLVFRSDADRARLLLAGDGSAESG